MAIALLTVALIMCSSAVIEAQETKPRFPRVNSIDQLKKVVGEKPAFVVATNPRCSATPHALSALWKNRKLFGGVQIVLLSVDARIRFEGTPFSELTSPTLSYFESGRRVDILHGWNGTASAEKKFLPDFIARNLNTESKRTFVRPQSVGISGDLTAKKLNRMPWFPFDLEDADFGDVVVDWYAAFSGANLRNANFKGAKLSRLSFAGADLTGARFENATLKNIFWGKSICPDGSKSEDHDFTCANHLSPK